mgnify:CR=1 FL=1
MFGRLFLRIVLYMLWEISLVFQWDTFMIIWVEFGIKLKACKEITKYLVTITNKVFKYLNIQIFYNCTWRENWIIKRVLFLHTIFQLFPNINSPRAIWIVHVKCKLYSWIPSKWIFIFTDYSFKYLTQRPIM